MKLFKKLAFGIAVALMTITVSLTSSAVNFNDYEGCEDIDFDELVSSSTVVSADMNYHGFFENQWDGYFYKIVCKTDSSIIINAEVGVPYWNLDLYDKNGDNIKADNFDCSMGRAEYDENDNITVSRNRSKKSSTVTATYTVKKGTYYAHLTNMDDTDSTGKVIFSAETKKADYKADSCFTIALKKGSSVQLSAGKGITWKTSNSAVASVSGGKITAKKAGTATITATDGNKSMTIKVKVT